MSRELLLRARAGEMDVLPAIAELLASGDPRAAAQAGRELAAGGQAIDGPTFVALAQAWRKNMDERSRLRASFSGPPDAFERAHPDPERDYRQIASRLRDPGALPFLRELLAPPTWGLAALGLCALAPSHVEEVIAAVAEKKGKPFVLLSALIATRDARGMEALLALGGAGQAAWELEGALLTEGDDQGPLHTWVRAQGWALFEPLLPALQAPAHQCGRLYTAMGRAGCPEARVYLEQGLTNTQYPALLGACQGLRFLADPDTLPAMIDALDRDQRGPLTHVLTLLGPTARPHLCTALADERPRVRLGALEALAQVRGDAAVRRAVLDRLCDPDPSVADRARTWCRQRSPMPPPPQLHRPPVRGSDAVRDSEGAAEGIGRSQRRAAWAPVFQRGPGALTGSHLGGRPYLADGDAWPTGTDGVPLTLLAQIDLTTLPEPIDGLPRSGLLQLFFALHGAQGSLVRVVEPDAEASRAPLADPHVLHETAIVGWSGPELDWPHPDHVGPVQGFDEDTLEAARQLTFPGDKLGGWPRVLQDAPPHHRLVLQLDSTGVLGDRFGDSGIAWVFVAADGTLGFDWQSL